MWNDIDGFLHGILLLINCQSIFQNNHPISPFIVMMNSFSLHDMAIAKSERVAKKKVRCLQFPTQILMKTKGMKSKFHHHWLYTT